MALSIALMVSGCAHALSSGSASDRSAPCAQFDTCLGGDGSADAIVSVAVAGALVGALAAAVYREVTEP